MDASSATSAVQRPGRGRVFDSIVDAIGDTPIVRLRKLPEAHGSSSNWKARRMARFGISEFRFHWLPISRKPSAAPINRRGAAGY